MTATTSAAPEHLTTGWEPGLAVDDTLVRRFLFHQADVHDAFVLAGGGCSVRTPGVALADLGHPGGYWNAAVLLRPPDDWTAAVDEIESFFARGTGPAFLWSAWPTPDLADRGWTLSGHPPLLVRPPAAVAALPSAPAVDVRPVETAADLADWERTAVEAYPLPGVDLAAPGRFAPLALLDDPRLRLWLGRDGGRPVAAAAAVTAQGVTSLAFGATRPEDRRRGYWQRLAIERLAATPDLWTVGTFSDDSRPGAEALGFVPVLRLTLWILDRPVRRSNAVGLPSVPIVRTTQKGTKMAAPTMAHTHRPLVDAHGNPASGPADGITRYDHALDRLLRYHVEVIPALTDLVTEAPDVAMGHVMAGYLSLTSTDEPDVPGAVEAAGTLAALRLNDREAAHRTVLETWLAGDWHGAARLLDDLLVTWPADLLGLLVGHQLDFFLGDAANLRDRVGRSLPAVDPGHPHHGFVRGMYTFGLEESGQHPLAQAHAAAALATNPDDVWAVHAMVHTHEMLGTVDEGIRFLQDRRSDWTADNLFTVHNWWHLALFLLEAGRPDRALAVYDEQVHHGGSAGVPLEMLDASALLWRLLLDGVDVGDRFTPLADAWAERPRAASWYVFNDLHATMALAGAGRLAEARAVVDRLAGSAAASDGLRRSNAAMTAEVGLPASRAVLAFVEGRHDDVLGELLARRGRLHRFGGSHAQRDALQRTILESAIRADRLDLATALVNERLGVRETSVWSLGRRAEVARRRGDDAAAAAADAEADRHRRRFADAVV